ncbi:MAG TPA: penicillin-binding transpeptidase domain-containing protein [Candidatus Paceibacterota bacterium]|nr:penicillin-binding transpeptidase domain-containing protein [Candidatus Paceibacterota bacterium]
MTGRRFGRRRGEREIAPDEIFLDSSNLPEFNQGRLEGKLEKPVSRAAYAGILLAVALTFFGLIAQAANLQIREGERYALQSERNRVRPEVMFAKRGAIVDRNGNPLVYNDESEEGFVKRHYESPGFGHLLGYVSYPKKDSSGNYYDTEIKGLAGVEAAFNDVLAGRNGTLLIEENALGEVQSQGQVAAAKDGATLTLSIDARAQKAFASSIAELAQRIPFTGAAAILMDVETGEIHALASYPEYDPNILSSGGPGEVIAGYQNDSRRPYLDRAIAGLYAPGSIVKPMEAAGALHDGIIDPEKTIFSSGQLVVPNPYDPSKPTIFKDWKALGAMNMRSAIAYSSDVYFYTVGGGFGDQRGLGIKRLGEWFRAFGFDTPTGIELEGEAEGFIPSPEWKERTYDEPWRIGNTYHTAIGQYAMQITPIEAARAVAAVANGGKLLRPTLLKSSMTPAGERIDISPYALQVAREGMRMGVTEGTSVGLSALSFTTIAGKTGTAQLGANNEYHHAWAIGFFPYEKPKYAYVVLMEKGPAGNVIGGIYATYHALSRLHQAAPEYFE